MNTGTLVRQARRRNHLSQERLARRAGTSQAFISRVERGEISPTVDTVERLLLAMGEQIGLTTGTRLDGILDDDPEQRRLVRRLSPSARLERAFAANAFAAEIHGAAVRR
jgi:transcriptional regulator with XRE-family HTH domain